MKDILEGVQICPSHGEFAWKTVVLRGHMESAFGRLSNLYLNVKKSTRTPNGYVVEVGCPECGRRFFVECESNT